MTTSAMPGNEAYRATHIPSTGRLFQQILFTASRIYLAFYQMPRKPFDYTLNFKTLDFRARRDLYRIGKGEQGVLSVEPYKSEILPHWRFTTVGEAEKPSKKICQLFLNYVKAGDFPGADMARKFLQMGWTRARRYAHHKSGRKYDPKTRAALPPDVDQEKAAAAAVFYDKYVQAREHFEYCRQKEAHIRQFEREP